MYLHKRFHFNNGILSRSKKWKWNAILDHLFLTRQNLWYFFTSEKSFKKNLSLQMTSWQQCTNDIWNKTSNTGQQWTNDIWNKTSNTEIILKSFNLGENQYMYWQYFLLFQLNTCRGPNFPVNCNAGWQCIYKV